MEQGILNQGATEEKGDIARLASFVGAMAISDLVKTTLGPKGMDKILQSMVRKPQRWSILVQRPRFSDEPLSHPAERQGRLRHRDQRRGDDSASHLR